MDSPLSGDVTLDELDSKCESLWDSYADLYERVKTLEEIFRSLGRALTGDS